jgi:DNA-directed RNA polymerase subunit M
MKFCPKCDTRIRNTNEEKTLTCVKCGHAISGGELTSTVSYDGGRGTETVSTYDSSENNLKIMDSDKPVEALPTTNIDCPKCSNNLAFWWMLQTRSADEATTQFYRCTQCSHTWRNYS